VRPRPPGTVRSGATTGPQLQARIGCPGEALVADGAAIDADPDQSEHHLARAALLRRLDRPAEAAADDDPDIRANLEVALASRWPPAGGRARAG
jgi:hypothetical protein